MQGPAGDDIPFSPQEGERSEVVRVALLGLQNLGAVQVSQAAWGGQAAAVAAQSAGVRPPASRPLWRSPLQLHIGENWAADYRGCVDGLEMDRDALHRHWAALQVGKRADGRARCWAWARWHPADSPCHPLPRVCCCAGDSVHCAHRHQRACSVGSCHWNRLPPVAWSQRSARCGAAHGGCWRWGQGVVRAGNASGNRRHSPTTRPCHAHPRNRWLCLR